MPKLRRIKVFFAWGADDLEKKVNEWLASSPTVSIEHRTFSTPATSSLGFSVYFEYLINDPAEK